MLFFRSRTPADANAGRSGYADFVGLDRKSCDIQTMLATYGYFGRSLGRMLQIAVAAALAFSAGCYDGDALLNQAKSAALTTSLVEVDLGTFSTTLPRDPGTGIFASIDLRVFGTAPRSKLEAVEKQLKDDQFRIRHETLTAVRQSTREELTDPTFAKLRERIKRVVNKVLTDAPLKEVGFYQLTVR
jgi:hypothetical protein